MKLIIDPEFQSAITPISESEFKQLEQNILSDGVVHEPLIVWNGVLLDGHNRYRIISEHPGIRYSVDAIDFEDRHAALVWILDHQLGRRNLTSEQKTYLIGKRYEAAKQARGGYHPKGCSSTGETCARLGKEYAVSAKTVLRAAQFARGVDAAEIELPGIRKDILSGRTKFTLKDIERLANATPGQLKQALTTPPYHGFQTQKKSHVTNYAYDFTGEDIDALLWYAKNHPDHYKRIREEYADYLTRQTEQEM